MTNFKTFFFQDFVFDKESKKLFLTYNFDEQVVFTETIEFLFPLENYNEAAFGRACFGLWIMAGISYFKAALPKKISFYEIALSPWQRDFFTKIYTYGLGEFFYQNNIDPIGAVNFPEADAPGSHPINLPDLSGTLIPLGGGKDSLTTIELLKTFEQETQNSQQIKPLQTWSVGHADLFETVTPLINLPHLQVKRTLCPNLIKLNQEGALNGHVPISALLGFLSVCTAILTHKKYIALSNESSANAGNTTWKGININHQYSKSLEYEKAFQEYIHKYISPDIHWFSFLRPYSELKIAEIFSEKCFEKYKDHFSSCNRNFVLSKNNQQFHWCGKCPKCAFVFLILAPFIEKEKLRQLFGANLFEKPELEQTYKELFGLADIKPFECVGEIEECQKAASMIIDSYPELKRFNIPESHFEKDKIHESSMPEIFHDLFFKKENQKILP